MHAPVLLVLFCTLAAAAVKWDNVTATTENGDIIFWDESPNVPRFAWYYDRVPKIGLSDAVSTKNAYYFSLNLTFAQEFDGLQIEIQVGTKGRLLAYTAPIDKPRANHFVVLQDWLVSRNGWEATDLYCGGFALIIHAEAPISSITASLGLQEDMAARDAEKAVCVHQDSMLFVDHFRRWTFVCRYSIIPTLISVSLLLCCTVCVICACIRCMSSKSSLTYHGLATAPVNSPVV